MLRWKPGPKDEGCTYHDRGIERFGEESIVVDVFVMPRIADLRPIAITIGRYSNYKPIHKREWQISDPFEATWVGLQIARSFREIGITDAHSERLGAEVERLITVKSKFLAKALRDLFRTT